MKLVLAAVCLLSVSACSYLEKQPDNLLTAEMLWQTRANAEGYLNQIYGAIQTSTDDYISLGGSDETSCSIPGVNVRQMTTGNWNPQSDYFQYWSGNYSAIRQSFVFEENLAKMPEDIISQELKNQYRAEALFLRGWFYWKLLRQYGPFVKVTGLLSLNDDYNQYPRASFEQCVSYINGLMDEAAATLPVAWNSTANLGRPTKGSCLAVKSQVALLAASPLWNGNSGFSELRNADGTPLAPEHHDVQKWQVAADAAKAVIDLGVYRLFTNLDEGDARLDPYLSYRNLFLTNWNAEMVFSTHQAGTWQWGHEKRCAPSPGGINMTNATQNIVDAYYMRNGRSIDDPLSGYVETGFVQHDDPEQWGVVQDGVNRGYIAGNAMMYTDREARFYASIIYNGRPVISAPTSDDRNFYSSDANRDGRGRAEFYYSGKSGVGLTGSGDMTGYCAAKNVSPAANIRLDVVPYRPYIHIRLAEIYLNYAEALNEVAPSHPDILQYLNLVRTRAGLPGLELVYPEVIGNQVEMRRWILRERQIELAFEGDRYFTLIRRMMMNDSKIQTIYRMNTITNDNGQGFSFANYYQRTLLQIRFWNDRMYLFPISQHDLDRNNALVQNPGW